jgi:hypothetical protein
MHGADGSARGAARAGQLRLARHRDDGKGCRQDRADAGRLRVLRLCGLQEGDYQVELAAEALAA